jgi:DNA polymerase-3 subunit gamma/tau
MAYLVLARKYRPQSFADLTGQEHVVQTLTNALNGNRVAHALLLCGPRGCGKTTTARIVAKALNCEKGPTPNPCGVCTPCREITAGSDVDVQEIDAASNTGVDNVRELRESAKYLPARDRFKIFIVDEVHMLSKAAFNAFLKTLEEPPGHVKFLFATTDPQTLPDTILSRCQRHNFRLVPLNKIVERLRSIATAENVTIDEGALTLVARQAAGSMRDSLSLLDQVFSASGDKPITEADAAMALGALDRRVVSQLADALLKRDAQGVLQGVGRAYDGGHDLKRLTEDLATHLRNLIAASVAGAPLDLPDHELKLLREQSASAEPAELARLFDIVHGALFEISRASQPRHALEIALLKAIYLAPSTSVQALLQRADDLTRRLGGEPLPPGGGGGGGARPATPAPSRPRPASFDGGPSDSPFRASAPVEVRSEAVAAPIISVAASAAPVIVPPAPMPVEPPRVAPPPPAPPKPALPNNPWERHLSLVPPAEEERPAAQTAEPLRRAPVEPPREVAEARPAPVAAPAAQREAPPPPSDRVESPIAAHWATLVEAVRAQKKMLGSMLEQARALSLIDGTLSLGFIRGQDDYAQKNIAEDLQTLQSLIAEARGAPTTLKLVELVAGREPIVSSMAESNERAEREQKATRLREGREHEVIKRAAAILGAEIEDVRDLGGVQS